MIFSDTLILSVPKLLFHLSKHANSGEKKDSNPATGKRP